MGLDYYLLEYDFVETHKIVINSTPEKIFKAVSDLDLSGSRVMRILFGIRGLYARLNPWREPGDLSHLVLTLKELINETGFIFLEAIDNQEIILGVVGKFWQPSGGILKSIEADKFKDFNKTGYCKASWNFYMEPQRNGTVVVSTETRVLCLGYRAKLPFLFYWTIIRPFSGWTRLIMLKAVKEKAEGLEV
ncbi:MAG: hypothetical protein OIN66_01745 [Candidatus Methanoperedens sp.]|nr:hypothetical protein [Candidatus Methanoperedens sp.]